MPRYLILLFIAVIVGWFAFGLLRALLGEEIVLVISLIALVVVGVLVYRNLQTNRKVTEATPQQRAEALQFAPVADKAVLYVFRNQFVGRAVGVNVLIDGREVAQIKSPRFIRVVLTPGPHKIAGYTGTNKPPAEGEGDAINAAAGDVLIMKCEVQPNMVGASVKFTAQPQGRADVQKIARMVVADISAL
jgi:hypothetical protein